MATNDIGRVTPIWRGFYSAATTYELNDIVIDTAGSVWWHKSEELTTGVVPAAGEIWDAVIDMSIFSGLIQAAITTAQTALAAAQAALAEVTADAERAETAADNAENSAAAASESAAGVGALAQAAAASAEAAAGSATGAAGSAQAAAGSKSDAEAYAVGKRGGEDVGSTDPTYHNNAKYYAEQAASEAEAAAQSAEDAQDVLDSIPEDYSQLSADVGDLKTQLKGNPYNIYNCIQDAEKDHYWRTTTATDVAISDTPSTSSNGVSCIEIPVQKGDAIEIAVGLNNTTYTRIWATLRADRTMIQRYGSAGERDHRNNPITIAVDDDTTKWVLINFNPTSYPGGYIVNLNNRLIQTVDDKIAKSETKMKADIPSYHIDTIKNITLPDIFVKPYEAISEMGNFDSLNYSTGYYPLFTALYTAHSDIPGFEEIDLSEEYKTAESEDMPSYISNISNGKILMYHLPPLPESYQDNHRPFNYTKMLLISGIHGGEKLSIMDVYILMKRLLEASNLTEHETILRQTCDIYIIPMVNVWGIENDNNDNGNLININRDFPVLNWEPSEGSSTAPLSQYETRCLVWAMDQIKPDLLIDHHTSAGDVAGGVENTKALHWGNSECNAVKSVIYENEILLTPIYKNAFPTELAPYDFMMGYSPSFGYKKTGTLRTYGDQQNIFTLTYEGMKNPKWDMEHATQPVFATTTERASISYNGYVNITYRMARYVTEWLNTNNRLDN